MTTDDDDGPLVYYKLNLWAFSSGGLKKGPAESESSGKKKKYVCFRFPNPT